MSCPPPDGEQPLGAQQPPSSLPLSASAIVEPCNASARQGLTTPVCEARIVGRDKVALINPNTTIVMPRPIVAVPAIGSTPGQTSSQVQLQSSAPRDKPVDLVAPKSKTVRQG